MTQHNTVILDGGLGRELKRRGAPFRQPEWSALALMEAPDIVGDIHRDFIQNGAQVITTNSYSLVPFHIGEQKFEAEGRSLAALAGLTARQAATDKAVRVAGSLPPLFGSYRPDLYQADKVKALALPLIEGLASHVDIWLAETQSLISEALALKNAVDEMGYQQIPFWVSFTLEDSVTVDTPSLRSGEPVADAVKAMSAAGVSTILFNCCQPETVEAALQVASSTLRQLQREDIQLGAYANAFPPQTKEATANDGLDELREDLNPQEYLVWAQKWQLAGASVIGGCCGIGPEHIHALSRQFNV